VDLASRAFDWIGSVAVDADGGLGWLEGGVLADDLYSGTAGVLAALSVPAFLLALLLLAVFAHLAAVGNLWLQPGYVGISQSPGQWLGRMILPWIAIAATQVGVTARLTRDAVLGVLGEDYIRTAYAKGLPTRRVLWLHVLRPSLVSVLPSISIGLGTLLGAAAIVDQAFALDGVGQALLTAVKYDDAMTIMGAALITVILISVVNLVVDVCQAMLDPRIDLL